MNDQPFISEPEFSKLKQTLLQREAKLSIISSVQLGLSSQLEVQEIYNLVGDKIREIFDAQVVMISTYYPESNTVEHRYAIEKGQRIFAPGHLPPGGFRSQIIQTKKPLLVSTNVAEEAARRNQPTLPNTVTPKTWMGVPMFVGDQVTGVLSLQDIEKENAFGESELRFLQTLAASMSVALENARLWEKENLYRKALEREFEIGREIQAGFLPTTIPQPKNWEIAGTLKPAREVAGDFFDVFELPNDTIGLVVADVCDKGLGAALFMTLFRSLLRAVSNIDFYARVRSEEIISTENRIKNAISLTNNYIFETHGDTSMFATVFLGILDVKTGELTFVNGGHVPPMVIANKKLKHVLRPTGPAVGAMPDIDYSIQKINLSLGEVLFIFTDGITDSINLSGKTFDEKVVIPIFCEENSLSENLDQIQRMLVEFSAGEKQFDDITMLAIRHSNCFE
ncbi:MAG: serine/threonine protein phosphatase [Chloroflexi bacterium HGW-Chloroflexi-8]|nr:MAG: serine/threonine protein phosphatase [Chloroflexi bacterium HGW-Chloroflexi-8]